MRLADNAFGVRGCLDWSDLGQALHRRRQPLMCFVALNTDSIGAIPSKSKPSKRSMTHQIRRSTPCAFSSVNANGGSYFFEVSVFRIIFLGFRNSLSNPVSQKVDTSPVTMPGQ